MKWIRKSNGVRKNGDASYSRAIAATDDVIAKMRDSSRSIDAARSVVASVLEQANNVPFMTTVYEATQEMKAPLKQKP